MDKQKSERYVPRHRSDVVERGPRTSRPLCVALYRIGRHPACLACFAALYEAVFQRSGRGGLAGAVHKLLILIVIIGAISAAGWVFRRMQMYGITHFESLAMTDLYVSAFDH